MSLPPTKRKVMGRIDLAPGTPTDDQQRATAGPKVVSRGTGTPIRRPGAAATPNANARVSTPGSSSTRARVDLSAYTTPEYTASPFASSSFASPASAPVTPRIAGSGTFTTGLNAGISVRSPSPSRPSPRPGMTHAASSSNITPRSAARLRSRTEQQQQGHGDATSSSSTSTTTTPTLPHSQTMSSLSSLTSPRSGRSSPVRPQHHLGHTRANTSYAVPSAAALARSNAQPIAANTQPPLQRSASPVRASSPAESQSSSSAVATSSTATASSTWRQMLTSPRPALAPLQSACAAATPSQRRRASSGLHGGHTSAASPTEPTKPATIGPASAARLLRSHDGGGLGVMPLAKSTEAAAPKSASGEATSPSLGLARDMGFGSNGGGGAAPSFGASPSGMPSPHVNGHSGSAGALSPTAVPPLRSPPTPSSSSTEPLQYAQLRVERKIADLEITNKSLLAINSGLEVAKHRQGREIRELKRRLREWQNGNGNRDVGGATGATAVDYADIGDSEDETDDDDDDASDSDYASASDAEDYFGERTRRKRKSGAGPREDPQLAAAHLRCKTLIDNMLQQARGAILWQYVHDPSKSKVLSLGEVQEREAGDGGGEGDDQQDDAGNDTTRDLDQGDTSAAGIGDASIASAARTEADDVDVEHAEEATTTPPTAQEPIIAVSMASPVISHPTDNGDDDNDMSADVSGDTSGMPASSSSSSSFSSSSYLAPPVDADAADISVD